MVKDCITKDDSSDYLYNMKHKSLSRQCLDQIKTNSDLAIQYLEMIHHFSYCHFI